MTGHQPLIAMRRRGFVPSIVFIETDPAAWVDPEWADESPRRADIRIEPADSISRLDLRFLIGLNVMVGGTDALRVRSAFDACRCAGARRVIATISEARRGRMHVNELALSDAPHTGEMEWQTS